MSIAQQSTLTGLTDRFIDEVNAIIAGRVVKKNIFPLTLPDPSFLIAGKALRTRFGAKLACASVHSSNRHMIISACVAVEIAHTASLLHDDIIDQAGVRRSSPALWKIVGSNKAVLLGDLLLCEAMAFILTSGMQKYSSKFVEKIREICVAEIEQESNIGTANPDETGAIRIARSKTGPLFAFLGFVCGNDDQELSCALEEAGYLTGCAYQLVDDLLDVQGSEDVAGKSLGTDFSRKKFTLAQDRHRENPVLIQSIQSVLSSAIATLNKWPLYKNALIDFYSTDLQPVLDKYAPEVNMKSVIAA